MIQLEAVIVLVTACEKKKTHLKINNPVKASGKGGVKGIDLLRIAVVSTEAYLTAWQSPDEKKGSNALWSAEDGNLFIPNNKQD